MAEQSFLSRFFQGLMRYVAPVLIVAGTIALTVWLIITREQLELQTPEPLVLAVEVTRIQLRSEQVELHSWGKVQPDTITGVTAEVEGRIVKVSPNFINGGFARAGEVLLQIDDRDYQTALRSAKAQVASAQSALAQEQGRAVVARRDWASRGRSNGSDSASELALRIPQLAEAEAQLEAALATEQEALVNLDRTIIRAPFDGLVQERRVNLGQYVRTGETLGELYSVSYAEIRLPIADNRLDYISLPGIEKNRHTKVTLTSHIGESNHHWHAVIHRTEGIFDDRSHTLFAVAQVQDPYGLNIADRPNYRPLRFGSFVTATIAGKTLQNLVLLPRALLRTGNKIWVVDQQNRLQDRVIKVLNTDSELMYVSGGLENGDRVCLSPINNGLPNTPVKVLREIPSAMLKESDEKRQPRVYENIPPVADSLKSERLSLPAETTNKPS